MSAAGATRIDAWIARGLEVFTPSSGSTAGSDSTEGSRQGEAEASPADESPRRVAFERILLLHLAARMVSLAYPDPVPGSLEAWALAVSACAAAALAFAPGGRLAALLLALVTMGGLFVATFPQTSNHGFLEFWCLLLLVTSGRGGAFDRLALAGVRASVAILLFYTGFQKFLHGTYFDAQFLSLEVAMKPEFAAVFSWLAPPEEIARIRALDPSLVGSGPFGSDAPLFVLASNTVVLFELLAPFLLAWHRSRRVAVVLVLLFTFAIQSGAREAFFGGLLVNAVLLFWPRDLHTRAFPVFAIYYAALTAFFWFAPEVVILK